MTKKPPYSTAITIKKSELSPKNPCFFIVMLENTVMDKIIGRKAEVKQVLECFESDKSELVSVYGRHR